MWDPFLKTDELASWRTLRKSKKGGVKKDDSVRSAHVIIFVLNMKCTLILWTVLGSRAFGLYIK